MVHTRKNDSVTGLLLGGSKMVYTTALVGQHHFLGSKNKFTRGRTMVHTTALRVSSRFHYTVRRLGLLANLSR